ncbi:uncharacterized protein EMH_0038800 [Eimeria mitis]|uniref:Transmembrane protein n=1 Tax=Eimeria mitis TaxID=44415 RepID=U6KL39_9EIME|nr:uncharacterized protein EMH_0038800 [Eimeria mitis]CDJ36173.1 hypothetical protein, conserved [Eimeria mitis]
MRLFKAYFSPAAIIGLLCGVWTLQAAKDAAEAARLAATKAARDEAAAKLEKAKSPEELQKEKEKLEQLKLDIKNLLRESKEYKQHQIKKKQEEEVAGYTPQELEETDLWKDEYEKFMRAERHKEWWERVGVVGGIGGAVAGGLAGFGKAHENAGGVAENPAAARLVRGAGTVALVGGAAALLAWLMRRQSKKKQKLANARLTRMQFEARTGLKPSDQNVLGPDERDILNPPKKKNKKKDDDE